MLCMAFYTLAEGRKTEFVLDFPENGEKGQKQGAFPARLRFVILSDISKFTLNKNVIFASYT